MQQLVTKHKYYYYKTIKGLGLLLGGLLCGVTLLGVLHGYATATEIYGISEKSLGLYKGSGLLFEWRVKEARELVDRLNRESPNDPDVRGLEARVLFFEGRYAEARAVMEKNRMTGSFPELVATTDDATRNMRTHRSDHFVISWADPRDEILVEPALEGLEKARVAVLRDLGFKPEAPVRVEIYPSVSQFTSVSTLTRKEVRTSGTIGLCKFNRLMIASPRATLHGYGWRDTLSHEYLHLAIYHLSRGRAPIWVHEGIAKYLEGSWRGAYGDLSPSSEALLSRRMSEGTLISLETMSPSVAKLESAEDTQLAFAEVATMMTFLVETKGLEALQALAEAIGDGRDDREALEAVWGDSFAAYDARWRSWVRTQPLGKGEYQILPLALADEAEESEDPSAIPDREAENFVRLGDLLRERGRVHAAAVEYQKAYEQSPSLAGVASRYIWGQMAIGRYQESVAASDAALMIYPELGVLWGRKGMALLELERYSEAMEALRALMEINPFHIPGRRALLVAARHAGETSEAQRQEWALSLLEKETAHPPL